MARVVIVGGGISGLATAYYLHKQNIAATIVECDHRLGGVIKTDYIDGCVVEAGPDSFLTAKPAAAQLAKELGLGGELIGSNDHQRATYIWKGGRLVRMPDGMKMMVPSRIWPMVRSPLLSWPAKLRAGADLFRRPTRVAEDRSISEFVIDHFGREVLDSIAEPMLAGVYGGDPALLSARSVVPGFVELEASHGSLVRGLRQQPTSKPPLFTSLKGGLQSLVDALVSATKPNIIHGRVVRVEKGWRLKVDGDWLEADHLIVACRASDVLPDLFPSINYNSARVIALGYEASAITRPFDGFGFLVPAVERKVVSALTWVPNKFNFRAPPDKILIRCFTAGGTADVRAELSEKLAINAEPIFVKESYWPASMPQYEVGHAEKVSIINQMLLDLPGLYLVGNAYQGIGIPDCIRMAEQLAGRVAADVGN
jgi:oxygen-dependent protoporphyrinogen oxidase